MAIEEVNQGQSSSSDGASTQVPTATLEAAQSYLQPLLNLMEEIRGDLTTEGLSVPGVVVCGDQSAGKPACLHNLLCLANS